MSASIAWAICVTTVFLAIVAAVVMGQRAETEQMTACVQNGGSWTFTEGWRAWRVCLKQDHHNG